MRLLKRGLTLSAVLGAAEVAGGATAAVVPAALSAATVRAALALPGGAVSVEVTSLANVAVKSMTLTKVGMGMAALLVGIAITGAGIAVRQVLAAAQAELSGEAASSA